MVCIPPSLQQLPAESTIVTHSLVPGNNGEFCISRAIWHRRSLIDGYVRKLLKKTSDGAAQFRLSTGRLM